MSPRTTWTIAGHLSVIGWVRTIRIRVTLFKKVKPSLVLVSRMAWGNLRKPEQHVGLDYKTLDKGYFESGIELNQIYNGLGLGGFYRYGPNQLSKFQDNIAVKISFVLNLGI